MDYRVLGPLEVLIGGRHLDLGGHRQQIVLASLVLEADRVVPVSRLMTAIYGESPPPSARVQVQICVSGLRRMLAGAGCREVIATRSQGYVLDTVDDIIDLREHDRLVTGAREAIAAGRREAAVTGYRAALKLWRGTALAGLESGILRSAADGLAERRLTVHEDCIELELELGRHRDVVAELAELAAAHPLRERLRGQLMLALYRSGRQAEALDAYRVARQQLVEDLGLEPSKWLQRLEHAILTDAASLAVPEPGGEIVVHRDPADPVPSAEPAGSAVPAGDPASRAPASTEPGEPAPAGTGSAVPATAPAPCMLPTDIADFTGRLKQIDEIETQLTLAAENPVRLAVPVVVIAGKPGIGKTSLAVHVSHRLIDLYPDGQLFADLHGRASRTVTPMQILERFLRTLGVPGGAIPASLDERAEMYRGLLSDRRVLIVLDNAGGEAEVLPLLPGNPRTAVIVTSRSRLGGLPGAVHVDADVLDSRQSVELLSRIAGSGRVRAEPAAARELAELCGRLPLALRIAGARLCARPHWSIEQLAGRLANESRRLDELRHGALGIRASISMTYDNISPDARRLFRLLAVLDLPVFSGWTGAALLDCSLEEAQDLLDDLADAQLVEITGTEYGWHSQYRFHDLIGVFARERLAAEVPLAERNVALERVLGALLFLAEEAHRHLFGTDNLQLHSQALRWTLPRATAARLIQDPMQWLERERQSLVAAVRQAAKIGAVRLCWDLAVTAVTLFESRVYLNDWRDTHHVALAAARHAQDLQGQAVMHYSTGSLAIVEKRFGDARVSLDTAAELFQAVGDRQGIALVGHNIAFLERMNNNLAEAAVRYEQALAVLLEAGDVATAAYVLHNMAQVELERDDLVRARELLCEALRLSREAGSLRIEAQVLHRMGEVRLQSGDPADAVTAFEQALTKTRELADPIGQSYALHGLGMARLRCGRIGEARAALVSAEMLVTRHGERLAEARVTFGLGELSLAAGEYLDAAAHLRRALTLFQRIQAQAFASRVAAMLARVTAVIEAPEDVARRSLTA